MMQPLIFKGKINKKKACMLTMAYHGGHLSHSLRKIVQSQKEIHSMTKKNLTTKRKRSEEEKKSKGENINRQETKN